uniref:SEC14 like lipid binding 6 n=1 Tax=Marmota marmota marmota TaxID=9994 RepID=A0A8C5ZHZ4_MARMA
MSGQVGDLSPSQEKSLAQFQVNVQDVLSALPNADDSFLLHWLRARSFDLKKSEDMLRKHMEFRKQQDLDNILAWQPPEVICGHDREGGPLWYHIAAGLDVKGLFLSTTKQDLLRDKFQNCELLLHQCELQTQKLGKKVEKITAIVDLEGLSLRHLWKPGVEFAQEVRESSVPVSAPSLFAVAFNLIKSYMSKETCRKVVILGDNWKQELSKFISPDQLPVEFGGTLTDPDGNPKCITKINYEGEVPKSYHLCKQVRMQYEHTVTVGRGSSQHVENEILFPGCVLRWQFASDGGDIGFGVFLKTKMGERQRAGEMTEVLPSQRYNAHLVPEDGRLTCLKTGVYVLRFDNTYSLVHSKHISYTVEVLLPDQTFMEKAYDLLV